MYSSTNFRASQHGICLFYFEITRGLVTEFLELDQTEIQIINQLNQKCLINLSGLTWLR